MLFTITTFSAPVERSTGTPVGSVITNRLLKTSHEETSEAAVLAEAYGDLGRLYHAYDLTDAAAACTSWRTIRRACSRSCSRPNS